MTNTQSRPKVLLVLALCMIATCHAATINGPLRPSTGNSRYFTDNSGKAIYLTGAHTWANLVDGWLTNGKNVDPAPAFDYDGYLNYLEANNHNFVRLWAQELPKVNFAAENNGVQAIYYPSPNPWKRVGSTNALDGKPKFDLTQLNDAYFTRLRSRVLAAQGKGIYVSIMLFEGYSLRLKNGNDGWNYSPFHASNNINNINGDPNSNGNGSETHTLQIPAITTIQKAYIQRVIDTVNDLDNVLYEISNEEGNIMGGTTARDWQYDLMNFIRTYQAGKPKQHPVGISCIYGQNNGTPDNSWLTQSSADWIAPWGPPNAGAARLDDNPAPAPGGKVYFADTDHIYGIGGDAKWVWKMFTRGYNAIYMDGWDNSSYPNPLRGEANAAMGHSLTYARKMNLAAMTPQSGLASTTYCLASAGSEYLAYQPGSGAFTVNLTAGSYTYEWFNCGTGVIAASGNVSASGGNQSFTPPFGGAAALYLKVVAANQVATPSITPNGGSFSDTVSVTITCATSGAEIRYTNDGSEPTASSALYSGTLSLSSTTTLKAKGFKSGMSASNTVTALFNKNITSGTVVFDEFNDGNPATNTIGGTGSGWNVGNFNGAPLPTESGGTFNSAMGTENGIGAIHGKDVFNLWDAEGATVSWVINSINIQTPHAYGAYLAYCWEMGLVSANASNAGSAFIMSGPNTKGGFYISLGKKDNSNAVEMWIAVSSKSFSGAEGAPGFVRPTTPVPFNGVLGPRWTATFPITVTATLTSAGWTVTTNQNGVAPISGGWSLGNSTTITDEFSNGAFLFTAGRNHGINGSNNPYTPNSGSMERVTVTRNAGAGTVSAPSISPNGGTFTGPASVTLTTATSGASIRYTTDGSTPNSTNGTLYSAAFTLSSSATVKAIAYKSGMSDSSVSSAAFTINSSTLAAPTIQSPAEGAVFASSTTSVTVSWGAVSGASSYLVRCDDLTGTTPNDPRNTVNGDHFLYIDQYASTSITFSVVPGHAYRFWVHSAASNFSYGNSSSYSAESPVNFSISSSQQQQVAAPTISPNGGTFTGSANVTLATATSGASIYYTLDGSTPSTAGTLYSGAFSVNVSATLKAIAIKAGMTDSTVSSAAFTIQAAPPSNGIVNGSFENGTTGWTIASSNANPGAYEVSNAQGKSDGSFALALGNANQAGNAIFSQTVQTTAGSSYSLQFDYGAFGASGKPQQVLVEVLNGTTVLASNVVTASGSGSFLPQNTILQTSTLDFTAASAGTTIRFTDLTTFANSNSCDGMLDFVRLTGNTSGLAVPVIQSPAEGTVFGSSTTSVTVTWGAVAGASKYLVRCDDLTGTTPLDPRNTYNGGTFLCIDNWTQTSITFTVVGGHSYRFWVHSAAANFSYSDPNSYSAESPVNFSIGAVSSDLVAHWALDETSGTSAADSSGNGHTGTVNGGAVWTPIQSGNGLQLDGSNDYVSVPYTAELAPQQLTLALWFNASTFANANWNSTLANQGIHEFADGYYGLAVRTDGVPLAHLNIGDGSANFVRLLGPSALSAGQWYHLAMTYDNTNVRLYLNGTLIGSQAVNKVRTASTANFLLGRRGDGGYLFNGMLDGVRLYNRALSDSEIGTLASSPITARTSEHQLNPEHSMTDSDGDGLVDAYEASVGLDPFKLDTDGNKIPDGDELVSGGGLTHAQAQVEWLAQNSGVAAKPLNVTKLSGKVCASAPGKDAVSMIARMDDAPAIPAGTSVSVDIAGARGYFTLDSRGRARNASGNISIAKARKTGGVSVKVALKKGTFAGPWLDSGIDFSNTSRGSTSTEVRVTLNGAVYGTNVPVVYTVGSGARLGFKSKK